MAPAPKTFRIPGTALNYSLRRSPRSKRATIRVTTQGNIEVVLPQADPRTDMTDFVLQHLDWIRKIQAKYEVMRQEVEQETRRGQPGADPIDPQANAIPAAIELRAVQQTWQLAYDLPVVATASPDPHPQLRLTSDYPQLLIQGRASSEADRRAIIQAVLQGWLRRQAQILLAPWLQVVSQQTGLAYSRLTVRSQKTIWGSCSAKKSISLNDRLLFLPPDLVHYVLVHELCHTRHLNHSPEFWALVHTKNPDYEQQEADLKKAWAYIPSWAVIT